MSDDLDWRAAQRFQLALADGLGLGDAAAVLVLDRDFVQAIRSSDGEAGVNLCVGCILSRASGQAAFIDHMVIDNSAASCGVNRYIDRDTAINDDGQLRSPLQLAASALILTAAIGATSGVIGVSVLDLIVQRNFPGNAGTIVLIGNGLQHRINSRRIGRAVEGDRQRSIRIADGAHDLTADAQLSIAVRDGAGKTEFATSNA